MGLDSSQNQWRGETDLPPKYKVRSRLLPHKWILLNFRNCRLSLCNLSFPGHNVDNLDQHIQVIRTKGWDKQELLIQSCRSRVERPLHSKGKHDMQPCRPLEHFPEAGTIKCLPNRITKSLSGELGASAPHDTARRIV